MSHFTCYVNQYFCAISRVLYRIGNKKMPPYPGTRQSIEVNNIGNKQEKTLDAEEDSEDWAAQYQAYLEEQENVEDADQKGADDNDDDGEIVEGEDWAVQYAQHCEEKEKEFFRSYKIKEL
mmetsp:Transcript_42555/g.89298  ORF Transcript_42555/g.89298 Transcript_42555/m.89298 type:complete len:121 (-) Transcript_42555:84-446(-)